MKALKELNWKEYMFKMTVLTLALFFTIPVYGSALSDREREKAMNEMEHYSEFDCGMVEADLVLEEWMTAPFNQGFIETELAVESWMTEPFGNSYNETELAVESWMTEPFGNSYNESELAVESWMTEVF